MGGFSEKLIPYFMGYFSVLYNKSENCLSWSNTVHKIGLNLFFQVTGLDPEHNCGMGNSKMFEI